MELKVLIIDDDLVSQFASRYCIEQSISNCRTIVYDTAEAVTNALQKTDIYILSAFANSNDRARAKGHPMIKGHFDKPLSKSIMDKILHSKKY